MILSIIIPAYNAEKYLYRCLESVSHISVDDYEVLVVDDGSTDNTQQLAYSFSCDKIKVISQQNMGLRAARFAGLRAAVGKYIAFIDSDDWVDKGMFEHFVNIMESDQDISICCGDMVRNTDFDEYRSSISLGEECVIEKEDALSYMIHEKCFSWSLCSKLYRRSVLDINLPNDEIHVAEDLDWNWEIFKHIKKIYYTPDYKYHYYLNQESMLGRLNLKNCTKHIVFKKVIDDSDKYEPEIRQYFINRYVRELPMLMLEYMMEGSNEKKIEELREEFAEWFPEASNQDTYDQQMVESLMDSHESSTAYLKDIVEVARTDFHRLSESDRKILVYGTGVIADHINRWNDYYQLRIDGYVVSDGQINKKVYRGKPVLYLSEINNKEDGLVVVLALGHRIQLLVMNDLKKKNINETYALKMNPYDEL